MSTRQEENDICSRYRAATGTKEAVPCRTEINSGLFCDAYHTTEFGEQDCTILAVMEKSCFPGWLKEREDREKTISDF